MRRLMKVFVLSALLVVTMTTTNSLLRNRM